MILFVSSLFHHFPISIYIILRGDWEILICKALFLHLGPHLDLSPPPERSFGRDCPRSCKSSGNGRCGELVSVGRFADNVSSGLLSITFLEPQSSIIRMKSQYGRRAGGPGVRPGVRGTRQGRTRPSWRLLGSPRSVAGCETTEVELRDEDLAAQARRRERGMAWRGGLVAWVMGTNWV